MNPDDFDVNTISGNLYKVMTSSGPTAYRHIDLSSVSTRELLNECYRRRAIERFSYTNSVSTDYIRAYPEACDHEMKRALLKGVIETALHDKKFSDDAIVIERRSDLPTMTDIFRSEVYICKHPTKVKR